MLNLYTEKARRVKLLEDYRGCLENVLQCVGEDLLFTFDKTHQKFCLPEETRGILTLKKELCNVQEDLISALDDLAWSTCRIERDDAPEFAENGEDDNEWDNEIWSEERKDEEKAKKEGRTNQSP